MFETNQNNQKKTRIENIRRIENTRKIKGNNKQRQSTTTKHAKQQKINKPTKQYLTKRKQLGQTTTKDTLTPHTKHQKEINNTSNTPFLKQKNMVGKRTQ